MNMTMLSVIFFVLAFAVLLLALMSFGLSFYIHLQKKHELQVHRDLIDFILRRCSFMLILIECLKKEKELQDPSIQELAEAWLFRYHQMVMNLPHDTRIPVELQALDQDILEFCKAIRTENLEILELLTRLENSAKDREVLYDEWERKIKQHRQALKFLPHRVLRWLLPGYHEGDDLTFHFLT